MYSHSRGDSFEVAGPVFWIENDVRVLDLTGYTGACELRTDRGELVDTLVFAWVDAATSKIKLTKLDTSAWPVTEKPLLTDIKLTSPAGFVRRTKPTQIMVVNRVTQ